MPFKLQSGLVSALAAVLSLACVQAAAVDLELGMRHDENVTRAEAAADQEQDTALVLGAHTRHTLRLDPLTRVTFEGGLGGQWWTRFEDVSRLSADVGVRVRRRADISFDSLWSEFSLSVSGLKHRDSEMRDGGLLRSGMSFGRRFGHRFNARLGYAYQIRRAVEENVFDLEQHELFGQLDVSLGPRWLVYFELGALEGELVATAALPNPRIRSKANVVPVATDEAFGRGLNPITNSVRPRWTYQIDGLVVSGEAGINYPLAPGLAVDVAARYVQAWAAGDNQYNGYIVNAGLLWQFDGP